MATVATVIDTTMLERTGYGVSVICGLMVADRAALGVAAAVNAANAAASSASSGASADPPARIGENEACLMHDSDKVSESATGKLTRSAGGKVINPFVEGVALMERAHKVGVYFSYGSRAHDLSEISTGLGNNF